MSYLVRYVSAGAYRSTRRADENCRGLQDLRISRALLEYAGYLCHTSQLFQQEQSRYSPQDVTIVVPTIDHAADVLDAIRSWQACKPNKIIIVTPTEMTASLEMVLSQLKATNIVLLAVPTYGKRSSMVAGLRQVTTELFVFADDDVQWKPKTLQGLLAGFDDPLVGGVQVRQRVRPSGKDFTLWESFGASRLTHRNIFCASSSYLNDGDVLSLAGRTMAYKTECLQTPELYQAFIQDFWRGKYRLKSGDDCFLTSWIYHRGWKTAFQNDKEYEIATTVKHDRNFLKQTVRWSRNTARFFCRDFAFAIHQSDPRHRRRVLLNWTTSYFIDVCNLVDMAYVCYTVINSFMSGGTAVVNDA